MSTQYDNDIPFSASHNQQAFKLLELPPELLALLESENPPTLTITSSPATATTLGYAILGSGDKKYQMRQKNTSNPIMILQPSTTTPTEADDALNFIPAPSVTTISKIEDTIELILQEEQAKAPPKLEGIIVDLSKVWTTQNTVKMAALVAFKTSSLDGPRLLKGQDAGHLWQSAVVGQIASQLGESMSSSELQVLISQFLHSTPSPAIELKPVYQLDTAAGSMRVKTVDLEEMSKVPMDAIVEENAQDWASTTQRQLHYMTTRPSTCFAFALSVDPSTARGLVLEDVEIPIAKGLTCGLWKVQWLLMFRRHSPMTEEDLFDEDDASTMVTEHLEWTSPETAVEKFIEHEKIWPHSRHPRLQLSATYDSGREGASAIATSAVLGRDIFYPAESFLEQEQWQAISMDKPLFIPGRDVGVREPERLRFSLGFEGWENFVSRSKWTIYFGGIRLSPTYELDK
ncbi:hypothetical protein G7Y89_g6021 [Cudoniella acicularis]|uniref:Uncharacterized protein n=1 Tax=Cudoniella acicularis TaxID=354080 RepID=A0A8H4RLA4_9HELO|nr:hypothetical protein G7Y89_g6021 [Cudoniella acicularis]